MKFSVALLFAPFVLLAAPHPATADADKVAAIKQAVLASPGARASVVGTVNANYVRYRRCARTSCAAVGQYQKGHKVTITCQVRGETIHGWRYEFQLRLFSLIYTYF